MTLFEYLAIAYTLLLSFAAMRIIEGLPYVFESSRRYWVHTAFALSLLASCLDSFWQFWSFRETSWDFLRFLMVLSMPGLIYFMACTLVPRDPEAVDSWREYLASVRLRYFVAVGCSAMAMFVVSSLILEIPFSSPVRLMQLALFVAAVVGATSRSERALEGIALLYLAMFVVVSVMFLGPGSLAAG